MNGLKNKIDENSITTDPKKKKKKKKKNINISAIFVFHRDLRIKYDLNTCLMKIQLNKIILKKFEI